MNTKTIARLTRRSVSEVNSIARDLGIAMRYDQANRCWRVLEKEQAFIAMLHETF